MCGRIKVGFTDYKSMIERMLLLLTARVDLATNWAYLHMGDRLVTVAALGCGSQANDVFCLYLGEDSLKRNGWQVMALIDKHLAVLGDDLVNAVFSGKALDHGDVYLPGSLAFTPANLANRLHIVIEKDTQL